MFGIWLSTPFSSEIGARRHLCYLIGAAAITRHKLVFYIGNQRDAAEQTIVTYGNFKLRINDLFSLQELTYPSFRRFVTLASLREPFAVLKLHQLLSRNLVALGVTHLYGLVGDANLFLVNAYIEEGSGRYIPCFHEANAVLAAIGFAQSTGRTGVATITHGPALTNVSTALAEAVKGGIPLVLLCGDTPPGDTQHLQKIDQREVVAATGARFVEMTSAASATNDLARAFRLAAQLRQPVVFNMRIDLQWEDAVQQDIPLVSPEIATAPACGKLLEDAVGMLAAARRPVILAGRGAIGDSARQALIELARRIEAPLAVTLKAQGLFLGESFDLGICGGLSNPTATDAMVQSDCILAFGASLSRHTTELGAYTKGKRVVQILGDALETPRLGTPSIRLIGDLAGTAHAMIDLLDMAEIPGSGATDRDLTERLAAEAKAAREVPKAAKTMPGTVDFVPALRQLNGALPLDRVLVTDLGRFVTSVWSNMPVTRPRDLVYTSHFGGIGCGLGQAIGAATAILDRPTVLVAGDGGFLLSGLSELSSARRHRLDLIIIICNDGSYGAEHVQFTNRNLAADLSMIEPPDFAAIAAAVGIGTASVTDQASLEEACMALTQRTGPILIDLKLDPTRIEI